MPGLTGEVANLIVSLKLDDRGFSGKLNTISRNLSKLDGGLSQMGTGVGQVGSGLARLGTVAAAAAAGGLAAVVTTAASFEQAFTGVEKTVEGTDAQLAELEGTLRQMARTIPVSFEELSAIGELGGAMGIARDSLDEFIDVVARLSVSTDLSSEAAATALGQLTNVLGLGEEELHDFADSLVALGNAGASTESQIVEIAARFGAAGKAAGLSKEDILALASTTASMGIEVEAAGGSLSRLFNDVATSIGTSSGEADAFADALGLTAEQFKKAWGDDALATFNEFLKKLSTLDQFEAAALLKEVGITASRDVAAIRALAGGYDVLNEQIEVSRGATDELNEESQKFFDTASGQWKTLVNNVRDAAATIGTEILPITKELMDEFIGTLNEPGTQDGIKQFAKDLAGGIRGLVSELKGTDFSGIIGGMKIAAEVAKGAFDAFRSLPAPIQQLAIAALVANKVSGGAVGSIAKGLGNILLGGAKVGGGLAGLFGGRGGSPANPMFVAVTNQIPGGGAPGVAPVAGGPSTILAGLVKAGLFVGVATIIGEFLAQNVTRPMDPTRFDFNQVAGASGNFTRQEGAEAFARGLAAELDIPLNEVKQGIVDAVNTQGLTFDQAVAELKAQRALLVQQRDAQKAAIAKYGEGAAVIAARVEALKLPLGLNNIIAGQIRSLGGQQVEQARQTRANTADTARWTGQANAYLSTVAAKEFSPTINLTNSTTVKVGLTALATQINRVRIAGTTTLGGFTETAY